MDIEAALPWITSIIKDRIYYFRVTPEINDFTKIHDVRIMIGSKSNEFDVTINRADHRSLLTLMRSIVRAGLFDKGHIVATWDIKRFFTYLRYHFRFSPQVEAQVIDLKHGESYLSLVAPMPANFTEAKERLVWITKYEKWVTLNRDLFVPLISQTLPAIEVKGIAIEDRVHSAHINYDLTGHRNGRLICSQTSDHYLNVHNLTKEVRSKIKLRGHEAFVEFDYDHMEVNVLQWISQDEKLLELLLSGQDLYAAIYELLFDRKCETSECRALVKRIFLPYFFGMQAASAAGIFPSLDDAKDAFRRIEQNFPTACQWIKDQEQKVKVDPIVEDCFGRRRDFSTEPPYKSRNFFIQSPAAVICTTKFVDLYRELPDNLLFNVVDAYVLSCKLSDLKHVIKTTKKVLEKQSFPELHLKCKCSVGTNLAEMKKYPV